MIDRWRSQNELTDPKRIAAMKRAGLDDRETSRLTDPELENRGTLINDAAQKLLDRVIELEKLLPPSPYR